MTLPHLPTHDHWIPTPQGRLFARRWVPPQAESGARSPIVLLHESLGSVSVWRDFPARLARATGGDAYFPPAFMTRFLELISQKPWAAAFRSALPVLGRDGTLALIQVNAPGAGKVSAKTGTFSSYDPLNRRQIVHGKGLAGYFTTKSGREIAFAIYVNNVAANVPDPALLAGQALGEIASIAWELAK